MIFRYITSCLSRGCGEHKIANRGDKNGFKESKFNMDNKFIYNRYYNDDIGWD